MSITEIGRDGEIKAREILKKIFKITEIFQADWLFKYKGKWCVGEVKHQERFEKWNDKDIEGHGLPPYQINKRIEFYKQTGIRCMLIVIEKENGDVYCQWLDVLEKTKYQNTKSGKRRIYDIKYFKKICNINEVE